MSGKNKNKSKRKPAGPEKKGRSAYYTLFIAAGIVLLLGIGFVFYHRENPAPAPQANVAASPDALPGIQTGEAPWPSELGHLRERLRLLGLPALFEEGSALHLHQHLDLFIHGKPVPVPAMIGVSVAERFISPVHTHDGSGEIHIESPSVQTYTIGQFFDIWGVRLTSQCVGGYCGDAQNAIKAFVDGQAVPGDPRDIALRDHQEIVIAFGTPSELPNPVPSQFPSSPGS